MLILPFQGKTPRIHRSAWIAPNATIIGDVTIGPESSVFYGCVLRGDVGRIHLGERVNVQDNSVIHVGAAHPCILADDVTVGHMAMLHGTQVGAGTLIGMKSTLLSGSTIGAGALVAAGAVVLEGQAIPGGSLAAGVPAKVRRELGAEESASFIPHAAGYVELSKSQAQPGSELPLDAVLFD